jgi:hypothetical protein
MQRRPAVKLWIENIKNAEPIFDAGKFIGIKLSSGKIVNRVNVIANVIDKFEGENLSIITIDDSTGIIEVRDFEKSIEADIGDVVLAIGTLKNYNEKIYIAKEIVKKVSPLWLIARKLELEKLFGLKPSYEKESGETESKILEKEKTGIEVIVWEKIKEMALQDENQEVELEKLYLQLDFPLQQIKEVIEKFIDEAKIYEPRPGIIKLF